MEHVSLHCKFVYFHDIPLHNALDTNHELYDENGGVTRIILCV